MDGPRIAFIMIYVHEMIRFSPGAYMSWPESLRESRIISCGLI